MKKLLLILGVVLASVSASAETIPGQRAHPGVESFNNVNTSKITPSSGTLSVNSFGAFQLPLGSTLQRPVTPALGDLRYNSDNNGQVESYINGGWTSFVNYGGNNKNINLQSPPYYASGFLVQTTTVPTAVTGTATQSGTTLTIVSIPSGAVDVGSTVTISGQNPEIITARGTGTGGTGTYTTNTSQTVGSATAITSLGTTQAAATVIPVANGSNFNVNQIAILYQGGSSQSPGHKNFACTIAAVSATSVTCSGTAVTGNGLPIYAPSSSGTSLTTAVPGSYLLFSVGTTTTSASASNGATSITLANAASYIQNQGILIYGGAASGANLITTITGVSGNTLTISPGISNASGITSGTYVQHDDSAALQAAVNVANYNYSLDVSVQDGYYQINTPPTGTGSNQINLPALNYYNGCCGTPSSTYWWPQSTIVIHGFTPAPQDQGYLAGINMAPMTGAIFQSSNTTSASSLLGSYNASSLANMTDVQLVLRNVTLRSYPNPQATMLNGTYVQTVSVYNSSFDTGETTQTTQPTSNSNNSAIIGSGGDNSGNAVYSQLEIYGYYWGIQINEHSRIEHVRFDNDYHPILFNTANGPQTGNYAVTGTDIQCNGTPHCIESFGGAGTNVDIQMLNTEHTTTPAWTTSIDDIGDSSNLLFGIITVDNPLNGNISTIVGGANLHVVNARSPAYPFSNYTFATLTSGAPNGTTAWCSDCTSTKACAASGNGAIATMINSAWSCTNAIAVSTDHLTFQPGQITVIVNAKTDFNKISNASTVDNMIASANTLTCTTNPTVTFYECGTSTTCASPTTLASVQVTATGTATPATISNSAIAAGDYVAWAVSAGACTSLDISGSAQIHSN